MGKYIRKAKLSGEVVLMELSAQSSVGVRTRARTLALQRHEKASCSAADNSSRSSSGYLQLRSRRRLEKPPATGRPRELAGSKRFVAMESSPEAVDGMEPSFGENVLELGDMDRNDRETTPCSLISTPETTTSTPASTSRTVFNHGVQNAVHANIPCAHEIEEFFAEAERLQQKKFMEKYNYDPVNDLPLPGRYEWVKLDSN